MLLKQMESDDSVNWCKWCCCYWCHRSIPQMLLMLKLMLKLMITHHQVQEAMWCLCCFYYWATADDTATDADDDADTDAVYWCCCHRWISLVTRSFWCLSDASDACDTEPDKFVSTSQGSEGKQRGYKDLLTKEPLPVIHEPHVSWPFSDLLRPLETFSQPLGSLLETSSPALPGAMGLYEAA